MKKRLMAILLLVTMLITQILPAEVIAAVGSNINTAVNKVQDKENTESPFMDVKKDSWYYDAVQYVYLNNIFNGTSIDTFNPDGSMTRGMFVTVLARMAGVDETEYKGQSVFIDVDSDVYYAPFVAWASKYGITTGVGNGKFNPNGIINREQMAVFFVRYFETFGINYDTGENITTIPADIDTVSPWAREMVIKLWKTGLLAGDGVNFNPKANASRAQTATLCMRTDKAVEVWYKEPGVQSDRVKIEPNKQQESNTADSSIENNSETNSNSNKGNSGGGYSPGGSNTTYYKVTFVIDSKTREEKLYKENTLLSTLPNAAQPAGKLFLGWYYDTEMTKPVNGTDRLTNNITLYAKFTNAMELDMGGTLNYVSALDEDSNFSIILKSNNEPIIGKDFIFRNITAPDKTPENGEPDDLNIEKVKIEKLGNGNWKILSANGGFTPGHTYQIELLSDSVVFDDSLDAFKDLRDNEINSLYDVKAIRYFNFSIKSDGNLNLKLNDGIKYINAKDINSSDLASIMEYSGLYLATTDRQGVTTYTKSNGNGSFDYNKSDVKIEVGDTVAVYKGTHPLDRKPEKGTDEKTDNDDVSYIKITKIEGSTYYYDVAEAEEVIFIPDVLPIDIDINDGTTGWSLDGSTITVDNEKLKDFISNYEQLSEKTDITVDIGDYLAFYTGTFGKEDAKDEAYGKIIKIEDKGSSLLITYETVSQAEIMSAMDLYDEKELDEEIKEVINQNKGKIQEIIEAQIEESNFFDEAGEYLANLTLKTDEVKEIFGDDLTLEDCVLTYSDGTPIGTNDLVLMGNIVDKDQTGKKPKVSVSISPNLVHFDKVLGGIGVRVEVAVEYTFKIQKKGNNNIMEVNLTAYFEQEVTIGFSVSGGAVWKKKWIFPYIADYRLSGSVDLGTYTGLGITATAKLKEAKEPWGMPWPKDVRDVEATKKIFLLGKEIEDMMEELEKVFPEDEASSSGGLAEKYADFMEDANEDWVDLVTVDLITINKAADPLHILAFGLDIDFVVSANLNVALGFSFQYENSKRHTFTLLVLSKNSESDSVDLTTNGYQFDFYVMGHIGIRAGIRAKITAGLISTKIAGVGIQVEAGAYARLWGYFYYHLENWKKDGKWIKDSGYSGALLIEIGAYLEVKFIAEALNGKYSYAPTIAAEEWPFWTAGQRENVYDFAYEDDPIYNILNVETYTIPSSVFDMLWMDLKTGELEDGDKLNVKNFDSEKGSNGQNEENFIVDLSNPNFTYNPVNNQIKINKSSGAVTQTCDMKITWKGAPLSKSSEVISRTITLKWSNEENAATIQFDSKGGSAVEMIRLLAGTSLAGKMPKDPTKLGYTFDGWYMDEKLTKPFTATTMPAGNTKLYAKWKPSTVNYTVEHYKQALDGKYILDETDNTLRGTVESMTSAVAKNYVGFTAQPIKQQIISADGSTKVAIYYDRNSYELKFDYNNGNDNGNAVTVKMPYESKIEDIIKTAKPVKKGYIFDGWNGEIPKTMPPENLTIKAKWIPATNTEYKVKHIRENLDGIYPESGELVEIKTLYGTTGQMTNAVSKTYTGFTAQSIVQKEISGDGSTVVEVKYTRNSHNLTWEVNGGDKLKGNYTSGDTKYGTSIKKPEIPTRYGYIFDGWYKDEGFIKPLEENATMPDTDLTLYAKWISNQANYTVKHIKQALNGTYPESGELVYEETKTGVVGENTKAAAMAYPGFTVENIIQKVIAANGSTVVEVRYTRNEHTITWNFKGLSDNKSVKAKYGAQILEQQPEIPTITGYEFKGWYTDENMNNPLDEKATMPDYDLTLYAKWEKEPDTCKVVYYLQNLNDDDDYTMDKEIWYTNKDAVQIINYEGFEVAKQEEILINGVTIILIYYNRNTYKLTWLLDEGSTSDEAYKTEELKFEKPIEMPVNPTRTGYTFDGWYYKEGNTTIKLQENATMPARDLTLYAKWINNTTKYNIWVADVQITNGNADDVLEDGTVSYNAQTNTLILNGANINGYNSENKDYNSHKGAIYAIGDLNIELVANSINYVSNDFYATNEGQWACGIYVTGNLTISGTGILQATGGTGYTSHGITVRGKLIIQNGNITAIGQEAKGVSAIYAFSGITINGGTVAATAYKATAGYSRGLECIGNITINGGSVVAQAGEVNTTSSFTYYSYGIDTSTISITGGVVIASGHNKAIYGNTSGIVKGNNTIMIGDSANNAVEWDGTTSLTTFKYFCFMPSENDNSVYLGNTEGQDVLSSLPDTISPISPSDIENMEKPSDLEDQDVTLSLPEAISSMNPIKPEDIEEPGDSSELDNSNNGDLEISGE